MRTMPPFFLAPVASDVSNLADIMRNFGDVTGLAANIAKSTIAEIRCADVDLNTVLESFPAAIA
jgi:hypothetical protein